MRYHPAGIFVERRDVIGARVVCLFVAAACFGAPLLGVASETSAATGHTAAGCERPG